MLSPLPPPLLLAYKSPNFASSTVSKHAHFCLKTFPASSASTPLVPGGVVTAWDSDVFDLMSSISRSFSLTTTFSSHLIDTPLTITNVYVPSNHQDSPTFLAELVDLLPSISGPWLLVGDFNMLRGTADKNRGHLDNHLCSLFNSTIDYLGVAELQLQDCLFTWSNMRSVPTLARLDRAFVNNSHTSSFPSTSHTTLPRKTSDHKPLLVSMSTSIPKSQIFKFENAWLYHPLFLPEVLPAWHLELPCPDAAARLAGKLKHVRAAAKQWSKRHRTPPPLSLTASLWFSFSTAWKSTCACLPLNSKSKQFATSVWLWPSRQKPLSGSKEVNTVQLSKGTRTQPSTMRMRRIRCAETRFKPSLSEAVNYPAMLAKVLLSWISSGSSGVAKTPRGGISALTHFTAAALVPAHRWPPPFWRLRQKNVERSMNKNSASGPDGFGPSFYLATWDTVYP
jgi:hypothetical protein